MESTTTINWQLLKTEWQDRLLYWDLITCTILQRGDPKLFKIRTIDNSVEFIDQILVFRSFDLIVQGRPPNQIKSNLAPCHRLYIFIIALHWVIWHIFLRKAYLAKITITKLYTVGTLKINIKIHLIPVKILTSFILLTYKK